MSELQHIMFDFDGTLADTSEGIIRSMHYAYDKLSLRQETDEKIQNIIGPPLELCETGCSIFQGEICETGNKGTLLISTSEADIKEIKRERL